MSRTRMNEAQIADGKTLATDEELADSIASHAANINAHEQYLKMSAAQVAYAPVCEQEVIVQKAPGHGQYSSVAAAIAAITDASQTKPYLISVSAGAFDEPPIAMKNWVYVVACDPGSTSLIAIDPTAPLITGCNNSAIAGVTLTGATGDNAAAVYFKDAIDDQINMGFFVRNVRFGNNKVQVKCVSTGKTTSIFLTDCRFGSTFSYDQGLACISTNGGNSRIVVRASTTNGAMAPLPSDFAYAAGLGSEIMLIACIFWSSVYTPSGNGIRLRDGGLARLTGTHLRGYSRSINVENVGVAPTLLAHNVSLEGNVNDIHIDHPGTKGSFTGSADRNKVVINPAAPISVFYADSTNNGISVVGGLNIGINHETLTDVTDLIQESSPFGVITGGTVSTTGVAREITVSAGYGYIADAISQKLKRVSWSDCSIIVPDNFNAYIYLDNTGVIRTSSVRPNSMVNFEMAMVRTKDNEIIFVSDFKFDSHHAASKIDIFLRDALGPLYATGSLVTENAIMPGTVDVSSGAYWYSSLSFKPTGGTSIGFRLFFHTGGLLVETANVTLLSNTHYDNNTDLVPLTTGYFTKHVLYISGDGSHEYYSVIQGQAQFATLLEAQEAALPKPPSFFAEATATLAAIIVQEGTANILQVIDLRPRIGFQSPSTTASDRHGNMLGLLADDHPQYLLTTGLRQLLGDQDFNGHNVVNAGMINDVAIEDHYSRHLPNGADPITTDVAVTLSEVSTNKPGIQNSLARSDHEHQVTGFIPVAAIGVANGVPQLNADSIVRSDQLPAVLTKTDLGLGFVNNTADADKPISTAAQLAIDAKQSSFGYIPLNSAGGVMTGSLGMPAASSEGIQFDGVFGWRDLIGDISPRNSGASAPLLRNFMGNVREWTYAANDQCDSRFHLPHDYLPGSDMYVHVHWAHNGDNMEGSFKVDFFATYAKGHQQEAFAMPVNVKLDVPNLNIINTPTGLHRVDEVVLSTAGGSLNTLNSSLIEVDGMILINFIITQIPSISGSIYANTPYIFGIDLHYQSTGIPTKNKAPSFYG